MWLFPAVSLTYWKVLTSQRYNFARPSSLINNVSKFEGIHSPFYIFLFGFCVQQALELKGPKIPHTESDMPLLFKAAMALKVLTTISHQQMQKLSC